ncbi:MAG: NfeD family protein [Eubacteriales bacterium]
MNEMVMWLMICVLLVLIECVTLGLTTIWFAIGALIAMFAAMLQAPLWVQSTLFVVISIAMLILTRPVVAKHFNKNRIKTNVEAVVGKEGIVVTAIDNLNATGMVTISGQEWTARTSESGHKIPEGSIVVVKAVEGVKVIVEEREEEN